MLKTKLTMVRDGNRVGLKPLTPELLAFLRPLLTYSRLVFQYVPGEGSQPSNIRVECFACGGGQFLFGLGHRERVLAALTKDYDVEELVLRGHTKPSVYVPDWTAIKSHKLRWKQEDVLKILATEDRARFDCPTGYGKSFLVQLAAQVFRKARFDIIIRGQGLCDDMFGTLSKVLPSVGICHSHKKLMGQRVMIYSADSLRRSDFKADFVLADELHELATDRYLAMFSQYRFARLFGFSASHNKRLDKADFELEGMFGPLRLSIPYEEAQAHRMVVPITVHWHKIPISYNPAQGLSGPAKDRQAIWRNEARNKVIHDVARRYDADTQVLIMVKTIDHAMHLKKLLPEFALCYSPNGLPPARARKYLRGGFIGKDEPKMTPERAAQLRADFSSTKVKKVIATGVWSRGVDFKPLQVLIRADAEGRPISDDQIPGRVSRIHAESGKTSGEVHDFLDEFDSGLKMKAGVRKASYKRNKWEQVVFGEERPLKDRTRSK